MLGRLRTALLIVSLLPVLALLVVGSVMLSNAAVTLADFVPGFSAGGILLCILALLVWLVHLWFQSSDLWLVRSGGYLVMATVVFVGFSAGSVAKTLSGASSDEADQGLAFWIGALVLIAALASVFPHAPDPQKSGGHSSRAFGAVQGILGLASPVLARCAVGGGELDSAVALPYAMAVLSTTAGFVSFAGFLYHFREDRTNLVVLWGAIFVDVVACGSSAVAAGYLVQKPPAAPSDAPRAAGRAELAVWLLVAATSVKFFHWVVSHAWAATPKPHGA